jgi:hypothetical protein
MEQSDELSLWLADGWLHASGDEIQRLLVEDLRDQVAQGVPLSDGIVSLSKSERRAGDFGMEIAGTLLAPVLVELLKDFWKGYLKRLGEDAGAALEDATTKGIKGWFVALLHKKEDDAALAQLKEKINQLADKKKLTRKESLRLLEALRSPKLAQELSAKK